TREDVRQLNELARAARKSRGELGRAEPIETKRGIREFAKGDRLYFLRNEKSLGVKNGSLGTVEAVTRGVLQVELDSGRRVAVDSRFYSDLDHGYAATVYKAQGVTVDRTYVLATNHFDRHSTYVALSRHRRAARVFYAAEDFADWQRQKPTSADQVRHRFLNAVSRARPKELAHDYLDREIAGSPVESMHTASTMSDIEARQHQAADQWRRRYEAREAGLGSSAGQQEPRVGSQDLADLSTRAGKGNRRAHGPSLEDLEP
ncbi:MAG TPA: hypothetical protein VGV09_00935, partial [Steroidobacteraceae bacterium]|nr:hypothetical protein [Steroidobacteraceae bacterium]